MAVIDSVKALDKVQPPDIPNILSKKYISTSVINILNVELIQFGIIVICFANLFLDF